MIYKLRTKPLIYQRLPKLYSTYIRQEAAHRMRINPDDSASMERALTDGPVEGCSGQVWASFLELSSGNLTKRLADGELNEVFDGVEGKWGGRNCERW